MGEGNSSEPYDESRKAAEKPYGPRRVVTAVLKTSEDMRALEEMLRDVPVTKFKASDEVV